MNWGHEDVEPDTVEEEGGYAKHHVQDADQNQGDQEYPGVNVTKQKLNSS